MKELRIADCDKCKKRTLHLRLASYDIHGNDTDLMGCLNHSDQKLTYNNVELSESIFVKDNLECQNYHVSENILNEISSYTKQDIYYILSSFYNQNEKSGVFIAGKRKFEWTFLVKLPVNNKDVIFSICNHVGAIVTVYTNIDVKAPIENEIEAAKVLKQFLDFAVIQSDEYDPGFITGMLLLDKISDENIDRYDHISRSRYSYSGAASISAVSTLTPSNVIGYGPMGFATVSGTGTITFTTSSATGTGGKK